MTAHKIMAQRTISIPQLTFVDGICTNVLNEKVTLQTGGTIGYGTTPPDENQSGEWGDLWVVNSRGLNSLYLYTTEWTLISNFGGGGMTLTVASGAPSASGSPGSLYLDEVSRKLYQYDGDTETWVDIGYIPSTLSGGSPLTVGSIPPTGSSTNGHLYLDSETRRLWQYQTDTWVIIGIIPEESTPTISGPSDYAAGLGENVPFEVAVAGVPDPTLQWQADDGNGWVNVSNGGIYSGATTKILTVGPTYQNQQPLRLRCVATNISGSATSRIATLTVGTGATITSHPTDYTTATTASFKITASGSPTPTYQWQVAPPGSSTFSNISNGGVYSNATTATLSISSVTEAMDGSQYRCVATNSLRSATSNSAWLRVLVVPSFTSSGDIIPWIDGGSAKRDIAFSAEYPINSGFTGIKGRPPPTYQWKKDGTNIDGQTSATLTSTPDTSWEGDALTLVATNPAGSATSTAATAHVVDIGALTQVWNQYYFSSAACVYAIRPYIDDCGQYAFHFYIKNFGSSNMPIHMLFSDGATPKTPSKISGTTLDNSYGWPYWGLQSTSSTAQEGDYRLPELSSNSITCSLRTYSYGAVGYKNSDTLSWPMPRITENIPVNFYIDQGATLSITASGSGTLSYQWQELPSGGAWGDIDGETSNSITVSTPSSHIDSQYRCIVSSDNGLSATSRTSTLLETTPTTFSLTNSSYQGGSISLTTSVSGPKLLISYTSTGLYEAIGINRTSGRWNCDTVCAGPWNSYVSAGQYGIYFDGGTHSGTISVIPQFDSDIEKILITGGQNPTSIDASGNPYGDKFSFSTSRAAIAAGNSCPWPGLPYKIKINGWNPIDKLLITKENGGWALLWTAVDGSDKLLHCTCCAPNTSAHGVVAKPDYITVPTWTPIIRSAWVAGPTCTQATGFGNTIDSNTATFWSSNGSGIYSVDMGSDQLIRTVLINNNGSDQYTHPCVVETSTDGSTWTQHAQWLRGTRTTGYTTRKWIVITLDQDVTCRYFRIKVPSGWGDGSVGWKIAECYACSDSVLEMQFVGSWLNEDTYGDYSPEKTNDFNPLTGVFPICPDTSSNWTYKYNKTGDFTFSLQSGNTATKTTLTWDTESS